MGILDDNNFLAGSFAKETPKRTPEQRDRSARRFAIAGIVCSILWLFGFGSVIGMILGGTARGDAESTTSKRLALAAIVLGFVGLVIGVLPVFLT